VLAVACSVWELSIDRLVHGGVLPDAPRPRAMWTCCGWRPRATPTPTSSPRLLPLPGRGGRSRAALLQAAVGVQVPWMATALEADKMRWGSRRQGRAVRRHARMATRAWLRWRRRIRSRCCALCIYKQLRGGRCCMTWSRCSSLRGKRASGARARAERRRGGAAAARAGGGLASARGWGLRVAAVAAAAVGARRRRRRAR